MDLQRRNHLLSIVANAAKAHKEWAESGTLTIAKQDAIYHRFKEIADLAFHVSHQHAEPLELLFVNFAPYWRAFEREQEADAFTGRTAADDESTNMFLPGRELWEAWDQLAAAQLEASLPKPKRVEPISKLLDQKVPDRQICLIYGFMDEEGFPDTIKLQEEIDSPGKHTGPDTGWVAPVNRDVAAKVEKLKAAAQEIIRRRDAKLTAVAKATQPAPESIEELVATGCSVMQISRMKKMTVQQVYLYCEENRLPAPRYDYSIDLTTPTGPDQASQFIPPRHPSAEGQYEFSGEAPANDLQGAAVANIGPQGDHGADDMPELPSGIDLDSLPPQEAAAIQEAMAYFNQGMDVGAIAQAMTIHGNKVRALLKQAGIDLSRPAPVG